MDPIHFRLGGFKKTKFCKDESFFKSSKVLQRLFCGINHYKKAKNSKVTISISTLVCLRINLKCSENLCRKS